MNKKLKSVLKYILSLIVAGLLLYLAFRGIDWQEFWQGLKTTEWIFIILSMLAATVALVFRAERWRLQLQAIDPEITHKSVWHGSNIGNFLSIIIPGVGEFVRCAEVSTKKATYDRTFGTIIMERSWDVLAILLLLLSALLANFDVLSPFMKENVLGPLFSTLGNGVWWILAGVVMSLALAAALIYRFRTRSRICAKITDILKGVLQGFVAFGKMKNKPLFLFYTAGIWIMYIFMTYFTFLAVPGLQHLGLSDSAFISAIGNVASVIPTPGNLGAYHYLVGLAISSIYMGLSEIGATPLLCATLSHGSHAVLLIVLGIWSYIRRAILKGRRG